MIGISADFDPVHKGHAKLIQKAQEIGEEHGDKVVIYMNKGYSANHAPFFTSFEARKEMALKAGADKVVPIEGLHHRLTLAYSVPIRIAMMIEDGVTEYVDAANVSTPTIIKHAKKFAKQGTFVGIPQNLPNRNVIRWFAVNEFLYKKYNRNMKFHIIPELEIDGKISGREIRKSILKNNLKLTDLAYEALPKSSIKILQKEIKNKNIPCGQRDFQSIMKKMNTYSRSKLQNIAYLNANAVDRILEARYHREPESIWATFRRAGYGPVLTRLATSAIQEEVTRDEVIKLMRDYEKQGVIPPDQNVDKVIQRAWYVSSENQKGIHSRDAHKKFMKQNITPDNVLLSFDAGFNAKKQEAERLPEGLPASIYVSSEDTLSCEMRNNKKKIKSPLKLPAQQATYLRLLIDSLYIPITGKLIKTERGLRIRISIHDQ